MKKIIVGAGLLFVAPLLALAQNTPADFGQIGGFVDTLILFINNTLVPLVFAIAFLVFIYGVFQYFILGGGDEEKRKEGRGLMLYAIIGFVLMVSIWGIVNLIGTGLGFQGEEELRAIPNVNFRGNP